MVSEPAAPAVAVVMVACDPGDWLEESLSSLAAQDYDNFSVLVVDVGDAGDLAPRVAAVLPQAHMSCSPGASFTEAANQALGTVEGAAHALLCHDDVALAPDALRLMVEEAYRRNGGLTCPKLVLWDAPERLLSVGMGADRLGVAHSLVERGELDQGQQDAAREVFLAPSAAVLVRVDLWKALGGFDTRLGGPGEDLDLCWRAQLAGARVVVAPQARARHLEAADRGLRHCAGAPDSAYRREANRLRTLWTCYSWWALALAVPLSLLFALAEASWGLFHHRRLAEALVPVRAIGGSLRRPGELWQERQRAQSVRRASDRSIWKVQSRGSARLRALVRQRLERGHQLAWAASRATSGHEQRRPAPGRPAPGRAPDWRLTVATALGVVVVVLIFGSRDLFGQPFPVVGQMPSTTGGVGGWWHAWWVGPGPGGLGGTSGDLPGMFLFGVLGLLAGGSAGLAVHYLVFGALLVGPLGVYIESAVSGSHRGRLAATVLYAALPLPYNALSQGHIAGLVAFAAAPWGIGELCRLTGQPPYEDAGGYREWPRLLSVALVLAAACSLAPALLVLPALVAVAVSVGSLLVGAPGGTGRLFARSALVLGASLVVLLPWSAHLLASWRALLGTTAPTAGVSVAQLLRFHTGPFGGGALGWAVLAAAAVALFIARSWRLAWACRLWAVALSCFFLAWAGARGWFAVPELEVVLAPAGAALALSTALGGASVESDLSGYRFGWRQFVPGFGLLAVLAAVLPLLDWTLNGQWDLPASGAEAAVAFPAPAPAGDYRVLWAGPESTLPLAAQGRLGSLALATSADGLPPAAELWSSSGPGVSARVVEDLTWAFRGETTGLGHLLRPFAVRYIVVPIGAAAGSGASGRAATDELASALARQLDLVPVGVGPGYDVFYNTAWLPLFSVFRSPAPVGEPTSQVLDQGVNPPLQAVAVGPTGQARLTLDAAASGHALVGAVPSGTWSVSIGGRRLSAGKAWGWADEWALPSAGAPQEVLIGPTGTAGRQLLDAGMLVVWGLGLVVAAAGLRSRWRARLAIATLELGSPGAEVSEINWGPSLDGDDIG